MTQYIIFGTGTSTPELFQHTDIAEQDVVSYCVTNPPTGQQSYRDKPLISLQQLLDNDAQEDIIIISDSFPQIAKGLLEAGISIDRLNAYLRKDQCVSPLKIQANPSYMNIGGGEKFYHQGWLNLEGADSYLHPMMLTPECDFPASSDSLSVIYSSHNFEHLDDATLDRVCQESFRVCQTDGYFVVKVPNFDRVMTDWQSNETTDFFNHWGFELLLDNWAKNGVEGNLDNKATCIICSIREKDGPTLFETEKALNASGYLGPVRCTPEQMAQVKALNSPKEVCAKLREFAHHNHQHFEFIHQNAWSREEFVSYVEAFGFKHVAKEAADILQQFDWIPAIESSELISSYYLFQK